MKKLVQIIISSKIVLILIFVFLVQGIFLKGVFEVYRFSEQYYIYKYGNLISKAFVYLAFILSFLYPIIFWFKNKEILKKDIILVIIGLCPAIYFMLIYLLSS
jgi:hypothetical protein